MKFDLKGTMNKKVFGMKVWVILFTTIVLSIIIAVLVSKAKKKQRLIAECKKRNGSWDDKSKKCIVTPASNNNSGSENGGSTQAPVWNPNTLASEISRNLEGYNFVVYPETADKVLALTDAQLRILYKYYNENYAVDYPTITQLFHNEWDDSLWGKSKYDMVVDRFRGLGLY